MQYLLQIRRNNNFSIEKQTERFTFMFFSKLFIFEIKVLNAAFLLAPPFLNQMSAKNL